MDLDLYNIGARIFSFYLSLLIITSVVGSVLAATGAPSDMLSAPIFLPGKIFYDLTIKAYTNMPLQTINGSWAITDPSVLNTAMPLAVAVFIVAQLLANSVAILPNIAVTIMIFTRAYIPELLFLTVPLVIVMGFLQLAVLYYIVIKLKEIISPYIPYR